MKKIKICVLRKKVENMIGPIIDWNCNGQIDGSDIAISLARAEEEEKAREDEEDED